MSGLRERIAEALDEVASEVNALPYTDRVVAAMKAVDRARDVVALLPESPEGETVEGWARYERLDDVWFTDVSMPDSGGRLSAPALLTLLGPALPSEEGGSE